MIVHLPIWTFVQNWITSHWHAETWPSRRRGFNGVQPWFVSRSTGYMAHTGRKSLSMIVEIPLLITVHPYYRTTVVLCTVCHECNDKSIENRSSWLDEQLGLLVALFWCARKELVYFYDEKTHSQLKASAINRTSTGVQNYYINFLFATLLLSTTPDFSPLW